MAESCSCKTIYASRPNGKSSIIKDDNGYYRVAFGKLNAFNKTGRVYFRVPDHDLVFGPNSVLGKRLDAGLLRNEYGHRDLSKFIGNTSVLISNILKIDEDRICSHTKSIEIKRLGYTEQGFSKEALDIFGWVRPEGPYGKYLEQALSNEDANVAFSIRSHCNLKIINGIQIYDIISISTWDYVINPGYAEATKFHAAGLQDENMIIEENKGGNTIITTDDNIVAGLQNENIDCKDGKCMIESINRYNKLNLQEVNILFT